MNRNLFLMEIRKNAAALMLWMVAICMLISLTMSFYPTFIENQSKVLGMLSLVPKGALQFKGISNVNDLTSILGFYAANNIIYSMVLGSIFAIVLSSNILLKEEYNKTAEYLLTRPLTRSNIYFSKLAVVFLYVFILNLVTSLAGLTCMNLINKGPLNVRSFIMLSSYTFLLNFLFGTLGLFISTLVKRPRSITTFSIAIVLILYFVYTLSKLTETASAIGYLSPFKYVGLNVTDPAYALNIYNVIYFIGISFLLMALSYWIYRKKDIYL